MILTSNRGFTEWGDVFGDPVVAPAQLDRLLRHAVVVQIEGSSYCLCQHAELMPEHVIKGQHHPARHRLRSQAAWQATEKSRPLRGFLSGRTGEFYFGTWSGPLGADTLTSYS